MADWIERKDYLDRLWSLKDLQLIKVVTGIRRCGKSTLLLQMQDKLQAMGVQKRQIISINFEALENAALTDADTLYAFLTAHLCEGEYTYIFLDEIQKVPYFEKVVDSLFVKPNVDIYITGSNAFLLSGELATYLSGRYIEINMLPLSFAEYKALMGGEDERDLFADYMTYGGLPYAAILRKSGVTAEDAYLEGIYNTVFVKDIEERSRLRGDNTTVKINDIALLKNISQYLSGVIGSPISAKRIADYLTSAGRKTSHVTVAAYLEALQQSYLFYKAERMDVGGKLLLKQSPKMYLVDLGFRRHILAKQRYDVGYTLENIVYFELLRRGYRVNVGKVGATEVDFVAFKNGVYEYYQVAATILDADTFDREIRPLQNTADNYKKVILTGDTMGLGDYNGISVCNVVDWLLK